MCSVQLSEKKRRTQNSTSDQRLKCFRDIMDFVLHQCVGLPPETTDFVQMLIVHIKTVLLQLIRRILASGGRVERTRATSSENASSPAEDQTSQRDDVSGAGTSEICKNILTLYQSDNFDRSEGDKTLGKSLKSDLSRSHTNEISDKLVILYQSDDFDRPEGEKTSGMSLKSHQKDQGMFASGQKQAISEKRKLFLESAADERFLDKVTQVESDIPEKRLRSHISTGLSSGKDSCSSTESSLTASVDLEQVTAEIVNRVISGIASEIGIADMENGSEARVGKAQMSDADAHSASYSKNFSDVFAKLRSLIGVRDESRQSCSCLKNAAAAAVTDAKSLVSMSEAPNLQAVIDSFTEELIAKNADLFLRHELLAKSSSSKASRRRRSAFLQPRKSDQRIVSEVKKTCEVSSSVPLRSNQLLNKATQVVSEMLLRRLSTADSSRCSLEDVQSAVSTADSLVRVLYECDESVKEETKSSDALDALSCFFDVREAESAKKPRNVLRRVRSLLQAFFSKASKALSFPTHEERVEEKVDLDLCTNRVITEVIDLLRSELTAPPAVKNDDAYFHTKSTRRVSDIIFRIVESCPLLPSQFPKERHTEAQLRKVASALNLQVVSTASEISRTVSSTVQQFIDADRKSRPSVQRSSFAPLHLFTVVRNQLKAFFTSFSKRVAEDERTDASAQSERDEDRVTPIYISEDGSRKDLCSSTESSPTVSVDLFQVTAEIVNRVISGIASEIGLMENGSEAQMSDADARSASYPKNSDVFTKLRSLIGVRDKSRQSCSCLKNAAAAAVTDAKSLVSISEAPNLQAVIDSFTEELIAKNADLFLRDELLAKSSSSKASRLRRSAFLQPRKSDQRIVSEVKKTCEVSSSVPLRSKEFLNKATQVVSEMLLRRLSTADSSRCSLEDVQSAVSTADSLVRVLYECDESVKEKTKSSDALDALSCFFDVREAESAKKPRNVLRKVRSLLQAFFSKASKALSFSTHEERVEEKVDLDLCTNRVITEVIDLLRSELTAPPAVKNDDAYFHTKSTRRVSDIIFRIVESCPLLPSQFPKERHTEAQLRKVASALNLQVVSTASEISRTVSSTVQQFIDADRKSRPSVQRSSFAPLHLFTVVRNQLKNFFTSFSKRVAEDERTDASAQTERDQDRVTPIYISEDGSRKDLCSSTESSLTASVDLVQVTAEIVNRVISGIASEIGLMENGSEAQMSDADARSASYPKNSDVFAKLRSLIGVRDKSRQSCSSLKNSAAAAVTDAKSLVSISEAPNLQAVIDSFTEELIAKNADLFLRDELLAKSSSSKASRRRRSAFLQPRKSDQWIVSEVKKTCEVSSSVPLRSNQLLNKATQVVSEMLLRRLSTADSSRCSLEDVQSAVSTADSLVRVLYECDESVKEKTKSSDALDALSCFFDVREAESAKKPRNVLRKVRSLLQAFFSKASKALSFPTHKERVEEKVDLDLCTNRVITEVIDLLRSELTAPPAVKNDDAYFHTKSTRRVSDIIFRIVESCPLLPSQFPKERHTEAQLRKVASALNLQVVSTASEISQTVSSTVQQFIDTDRKSRPSVQRSSFAPLHLFTVVRNQLKNFFTSFSKRVADDERTDASAQSERDQDRVTPIYISEDGTVHELTELEDLSLEEMIHQRSRAITDVIANLLLRNVDRAGDVGQCSSDSVPGRGNNMLRSNRFPSECVYTFTEESIKAVVQNALNAGPSAGDEAQESSFVAKSTGCPFATALAREIEEAAVEETREHLNATDQQNRPGRNGNVPGSDGCSSLPAAEDQEKKKRLGFHFILRRNGSMIRRGVKCPKKSKKKRSRVPLTSDDQPTPSTSANLHNSSHRESKVSGSVFKNARRRLGRIFSNISKSFTGCFNSETAP
ncbi:uncharacterized protein LOC128319901 isoform X1 [Pangasianodon hypophthalmus]|uniref:uncharacterized protein LOC128319901 isoform X1 n=2 Tax=Pangasianodon hypophthalmus TaxID=310915 RepID=UPI002307C2CA|nr:uncharacterized protein LOC128319901 isoform X1 [Pangasianodon hypophthalmus]